MLIEQVIQKSDLIFLKGAAKVGKLTFSLFSIVNYLPDPSCLVLSGVSKPLLSKRFKAMRHLEDEKLLSGLDSAKRFSLKEGYVELVDMHGSNLLIDDIKTIFQRNKVSVLVIHRIDLFFDIHQVEEAKEFLDSLVSLRSELGIKVFITALVSNDVHDFMEDLVENYVDTSLHVKKESTPIIEVTNSIFPAFPNIFSFQKIGQQLVLKPVVKQDSSLVASLPSAGLEEIESASKVVVLAAENEHVVSLSQYIFDRKDFSLKISNSLSETVHSILQNPRLIIYNPADNEFDLKLCQVIKDNKLSSKLIYLVNKGYVRVEDKIKAVNLGCEDVLSVNFNFEEYILSIEKSLKESFYSSLVSQLPENLVVNNQKQFFDIVDNLAEERVFFCTVRLKSNIPEDLLLAQTRKKDFMFYSEGFVIFCLINLSEEQVQPFLNKVNALLERSSSYIISDIEVVGCLNWQEEKNKVL